LPCHTASDRDTRHNRAKSLWFTAAQIAAGTGLTERAVKRLLPALYRQLQLPPSLSKHNGRLFFRDNREWFAAGQKRLARITGLNGNEIRGALDYLFANNLLLSSRQRVRDNFGRTATTFCARVNFAETDRRLHLVLD
jgi:predicted ArsR family transcriptional regulator